MEKALNKSKLQSGRVVPLALHRITLGWIIVSRWISSEITAATTVCPKSIRSIHCMFVWKDTGLIWWFNGLVDIQPQIFTILFCSSAQSCVAQPRIGSLTHRKPPPDLSNTWSLPSLPLLSYLGQLPSSWLPLGWYLPQFGRESHHRKALLFLNPWPL